MTLLISSIAPALIILYLIYRHDVDREPRKLLLKCFFGGILSILMTLILVLPFNGISMPTGFAKSFYDAFVTAGIPEELSKWLILYWLVRKAPAFDQYYDGIIYAVFVSMGFALVENIMYVMNGDMGTVISRAIMAVPGHMLFAVAMGYYFSMAKFDTPQKAKVHMAMSLIIPIALHGTYDFLLMYTSSKADHSPLLAVGIIIVFVLFDIYLWRLGLKRIKAHKSKDLGMS